MKDLPIFNGPLALEIAIGMGLYEHREYHSCMERILQSTLDWRVAGLAKRSEHLPASKRQQFIEDHYPYRWMLSFPNQLRAAIVVAGMSFLESILLSLCEETAIRFNTLFIEPQKNRVVESCAFLQRIGNLAHPSRKELKPVESLVMLRNKLVHGGMQIQSDKIGKRTRETFSQLPNIRWDESGFLVLSKEACEYMYQTIENTFLLLRDEIILKWEPVK